MNRIWISFEGDFPQWSDYCLDQRCVQDIENYLKNIINMVEWNCDKKVKAIKIESVDNKFDPIYQVVK